MRKFLTLFLFFLLLTFFLPFSVQAARLSDLSIGVDYPKTVKTNETITYNVTVRSNPDFAKARGVRVSIDFMAGVYPKQWPSNCIWRIALYNINNLQCDLGVMGRGDQVTFSYSYQSPTTQVVNTYLSVESTQADSNPSDNQVNAATTVVE